MAALGIKEKTQHRGWDVTKDKRRQTIVTQVNEIRRKHVGSTAGTNQVQRHEGCQTQQQTHDTRDYQNKQEVANKGQVTPTQT